MRVGFYFGALGLDGSRRPWFTVGYDRTLYRGASYVRISTPPELYWWDNSAYGGTVLFPREQTVNLTLTPSQPAHTALQVSLVLLADNTTIDAIFTPDTIQWQAGEGDARIVSVTLPASAAIDTRFSFGYDMTGSDAADLAIFADGIKDVTQLPMAVTAAYPKSAGDSSVPSSGGAAGTNVPASGSTSGRAGGSSSTTGSAGSSSSSSSSSSDGATASVTFLLQFSVNASTASQTSFLSQVRAGVASMAAVSPAQVTATYTGAAAAGSRRLLQVSSQVHVSITTSSTTATTSAYNSFVTQFSSSDSSSNPLLSQGLDRSTPPSPTFSALCADGSTQTSTDQCTNNAAAGRASIDALGLGVLATGVSMVHWLLC